MCVFRLFGILVVACHKLHLLIDGTEFLFHSLLPLLCVFLLLGINHLIHLFIEGLDLLFHRGVLLLDRNGFCPSDCIVSSHSLYFLCQIALLIFVFDSKFFRIGVRKTSYELMVQYLIHSRSFDRILYAN